MVLVHRLLGEIQFPCPSKSNISSCWRTRSPAGKTIRVSANTSCFVMTAHELLRQKQFAFFSKSRSHHHAGARTDFCARYNSYGVLPNPQQSSSCQRTSSCVRDLQVAVSSKSSSHSSCYILAVGLLIHVSHLGEWELCILPVSKIEHGGFGRTPEEAVAKFVARIAVAC